MAVTIGRTGSLEAAGNSRKRERSEA